jgi:hypothetical protein
MFRDNFDVAESTAKAPRETSALSSDADLSQYSSLVGNGKKLDTDKLGIAGDTELLMALNDQREASDDQSQSGLDSHSQEIAKLLKGASPEDAAEAFADYIDQNGDAMYAAAEAADPNDPLGCLESQLNQELKDTDYTAYGDRQAAELSLYSKGGDFITNVPIGPSNSDMFGIPKN